MIRWLYRLIVPDSALSGWRSFHSAYYPERPWSLSVGWYYLDGSCKLYINGQEVRK